MNRQRFLSNVALGAAGVAWCADFAGPKIARAAEPGAVHWGYEGADGPSHWGSLAPDFSPCARGQQQSPIDLTDAGIIRANLGALAFDYHPTPLRIVNNGHTIQVNYGPGSTLTARGKKYQIVQFHFHTPSEHTRNGKLSDMELHIVHQGADKELAVVGVFLEQGPANEALAPIWQAIPTKVGAEKLIAGTMVNVAALLPTARSKNLPYFFYMGSLTTPPCSEGVRWLVLAQPVALSLEQIARFREVIPMNARPLQRLDRRFVLEQL